MVSETDSVILVTGGSGYIGQHLIPQLSAIATVVLLYRHKLPEQCGSVFPVCSDLSCSKLLAAPLRGVQTVIHLAWETHLDTTDSVDVTQSINIKNMKNLIKASENAGVKRFIFLSLPNASKDATHRSLQEKYAAEQLLLNSLVPEKIILKPSILFGSQFGVDKFSRSIMRLLSLPCVYPLPRVKQKFNLIHIDDLCQVILNCCELDFPFEANILEVKGENSFDIESILKLYSQYIINSAKIPIRPFLGHMMASFIESNKFSDKTIPKLNWFVSASQSDDQNLKAEKRLYQNVKQKQLEKLIQEREFKQFFVK